MYDAYQAGIDAGLDPSLAQYMGRYVQIESGGNPNARTGSYSGLLQQGPEETARYGGNDLASGARMYADRAKWFSNNFGRAPTPTELYLTNQQGEGGIGAHLANPDAPAWQNMYSTAEGQKKGAAWARKAIWGNVPDDIKAQFPGGVDSLTSKQFMDLWQHKVERTPFASAFADNRKSNMDPDNQYAYAPAYAGVANETGIGGLFDKLRAGGPGALFGAPNGVFPGANGQAGYDLGNRLQRAAAWGMGQPAVAAALANQNHRKFVQIGTDEYGNPIHGFVDEQRGTVTPINGAMMGGGAAGMGGDAAAVGNQVSAAIKSGKTGDELLALLPKRVANDITNIDEGNVGFNENGMLKTPYGKMVVDALKAYNPNYDASVYEGRKAARRDWATKSAELTRRANQASLHGGEMVDSFKQVGGSDYPVINRITNFLNEQSGGAGPQALRTNVTQLASELATFVGGGQISDTRFKEWADAFPVNGSDAQKRAAMSKVYSLFKDSYQALEEKRRQAVGDRAYAKMGPLMPPQMQAAMEKMRAYGEGTDTQQPTISNIRQIQ